MDSATIEMDGQGTGAGSQRSQMSYHMYVVLLRDNVSRTDVMNHDNGYIDGHKTMDTKA